MTSANFSYAEPLYPDDIDRALAQTAGLALSRLTGRNGAVHVDAVGDKDRRKESFVLPAAAVQIMLDMLGQMAAGNAVTVVPVEAELTMQEAAEVLGVSRPSLVSLLEEGRLPFHKPDTHRRVRYGELLAYKRQEHEACRQALDELACRAQELNFGQ